MIILDGKKIKQNILDELKEEVTKLSNKPKLVVIQVGNNEASNIYINQKKKMCEYIGYEFTLVKYPDNISEDTILKKIDSLNKDTSVSGILVQMPIPMDSYKIQNAINPLKDVDGLTDINFGKLAHGYKSIYPCTAYGIMELLRRYNISIKGKKVTVVGRSNLVGRPVAMMMLNEDATVTICHSKTVDLAKETKVADILVVATGHAGLIKADMVKEDAIVIDVGINNTANGITGDVCFQEVSEKASYITPVPGGIGQMTVAMLGKNILETYKLQKDGNK